MTESSSSSRLGWLTWPEAVECRDAGSVLVLPIGSLEQHGPHLPLLTDVLIPEGVAHRLAERRAVTVAPPVVYAGYSRPRTGGGRHFLGSVGIGSTALAATVDRLIVDFLRHGWTRILVFNGHFENSGPLYDGLESAVEGRECTVVLVNWWELIDEADLDSFFGGDFPGWELEHAGFVETSLMLALYPSSVRWDRAIADVPRRYLSYDVFPEPSDLSSVSGVMADPTGASAAAGEALVDRIVDGLICVLEKEFAGRGDANIRSSGLENGS